MMMHFMQSMSGMQMQPGAPFGQRGGLMPPSDTHGSTVDLPRPSSNLALSNGAASVAPTADEPMAGAADGGHGHEGLGGGVYAATPLEDLTSCN